jgi:hypothetical protein
MSKMRVQLIFRTPSEDFIVWCGRVFFTRLFLVLDMKAIFSSHSL